MQLCHDAGPGELVAVREDDPPRVNTLELRIHPAGDRVCGQLLCQPGLRWRISRGRPFASARPRANERCDRGCNPWSGWPRERPVRSLALRVPFTTWETVEVETPATRATLAIVIVAGTRFGRSLMIGSPGIAEAHNCDPCKSSDQGGSKMPIARFA